jgi:cellulose synthase/poly-beta-1,6-N-acetylglucosamine synthase-like glycosyltransferase
VLAAVVVTSVVATVVGTMCLLFGRRARHAGYRRGRWAVGAVALSALPAFALPALGVPSSQAGLAGLVCAVASMVWLPKTRRWSVAAHVAWASGVTGGAAYLVYTAAWTASSQLSMVGLAGGVMLWLLELAAYLFSLAFLWEMIDAVGSRSWHRRVPHGLGSWVGGAAPFVSIHVPTHNEPPDMVIETLRSLLALSYPAFEAIVVDNNTVDEHLWRPVERFCAAHPERLRFYHLAPWPGYKSGALNFGLSVADPRAQIIAVVDSDYLVDPDWLAATVPHFTDERVGFVQTPQDYRGWQGSGYFRRLYHSYDYFFAVSQRSRDERDAAIFGGTMGLVRRGALHAVGGWDEWCITEDAELSLRLLKAGWSGRHLDRGYGCGIMPLTFEALKGQRFRWCFGGVQILRRHWRALLPWDRDPHNRLTRSQRLAYLVGGLQWFGDLLGLAFLALLLLAASDLALGAGLVVRRLSPLLLVLVPVLTGFSLVRAMAVVRRAGAGTWREAAGAMFIWLALGLTVARACVRGAVEPAGAFLRTPKVRGQGSLRASLRMNLAETVLGAAAAGSAMLVLVVADRTAWSITLAALLGVTATGYFGAPWNSVAALRADLPARLEPRRRSERARAWATDRAKPRRVTLAALLLGGSALAIVSLAPSVGVDSTAPLHGWIGLGGAAKPRPTSAGQPSRAGGAATTGQPRQPSGTPPTAAATTSSSAGGRSAAPTGTPAVAPVTLSATPGTDRATFTPPTISTTPPTATSPPRATPTSQPHPTPTGRPTSTPGRPTTSPTHP